VQIILDKYNKEAYTALRSSFQLNSVKLFSERFAMSGKKFTEYLLEKLQISKLEVREFREKLNLRKLIDYFNSLEDGVDVVMMDFSSKVCQLVGNKYAGSVELGILQKVILAHLDGINNQYALKEYLEHTRDEIVGNACLDEMFAEPISYEPVGFDSPLSWKIKRAFTAVQILNPSNATIVACEILDRWPDLPGGQRGTAGLCGVIQSYSNRQKNGNRAVTIGGKGIDRPTLTIVTSEGSSDTKLFQCGDDSNPTMAEGLSKALCGLNESVREELHCG
jgi:hypothetical protein